MRINVQPIKPMRNIFDYREYEREIKDAVDDMGTVIVDELDKVVADWTHRPEFRKRLTVSSDNIAVDVYPTGENARIWVYVDQGTRPHVIRPRKAKRLRFQAGYAPRTTPGGGYGGPGKASGDMVHAPIVHHPGNAPREFTARILNANRQAFRDAIRQAIREASQ